MLSIFQVKTRQYIRFERDGCTVTLVNGYWFTTSNILHIQYSPLVLSGTLFIVTCTIHPPYHPYQLSRDFEWVLSYCRFFAEFCSPFPFESPGLKVNFVWRSPLSLMIKTHTYVCHEVLIKSWITIFHDVPNFCVSHIQLTFPAFFHPCFSLIEDKQKYLFSHVNYFKNLHLILNA